MLATFRTDQIPHYHKERHLNAVSTKKYQAKQIFKSMALEMDKSSRDAMDYDTGFLSS